ncbi:heme ABC transporter permease [Salmonella enterica subsp. arizonae]|uniref:Heme ABC transporter permease n=5 Tax=Salmonella enterica TaxID=28901 RepID=A0A379T2Z7_SALER|nr:heme ABC transporter permease [Salmonella enterica subsp. arizonae]
MMWRIFRLELRVAFRHSAEIANPLWFFLIVITLFPLSIGPEPQLLARIAPGIILVAALLSSLLALERLFRDDLQDGSLEQLMLLPLPLPAVVLAKVLAHWGGHRPAADYSLPAGGAAAGNGRVRLENDGADLITGHADAGFSRRAGRGINGWAQTRRRSAERAGAAADHPVTDFCYRRDGGGLHAPACRGVYGDSGRAAGWQRDVKSLCDGGSVTHQSASSAVFIRFCFESGDLNMWKTLHQLAIPPRLYQICGGLIPWVSHCQRRGAGGRLDLGIRLLRRRTTSRGRATALCICMSRRLSGRWGSTPQWRWRRLSVWSGR